MTNQERNREALIQHVADLEAIIRRRNEQIAAQVEIIEEVRRDLDDYQAMHSRQIETIARLQENPRPLTADDITDEMVERAREALRQHGIYGAILPAIIHTIFTAALTPPPSRPEGAEGVETALLDADEAGFFNIAPRAIQDLADWLAAERGVRVTTEEGR